MGSFNPNLKTYELKINRGVICHDNEELRKISRRTDLWIWQILTRALESLKNFHFNGFILSKGYIVWTKKYRGVIFHATEEGCKIWRGIVLSFENWHKEFNKFWPEHWKVSKNFTLMGSFWAKYILFELQKYRGVGIFHEAEEGYKIWRRIDLSFQNWHKEFDKFWESQNSSLSYTSFKQSINCLS